MRKPELIERMLQEDEKEKPQVAEEKKESEEPVEKKKGSGTGEGTDNLQTQSGV